MYIDLSNNFTNHMFSNILKSFYPACISFLKKVECGPMWFANQWSKCSSKCKGVNGVKTRMVMCGVMKVIPPATSDNATAGNSTEESGSGEEDEGEGSSKRRKRQAEDTEEAPNSPENSMGEKSIVIVEDSECDEASKYEN